MKIKILAIFIVFTITIFSQKFDGLALTPPMGWNSWNKMACDVNEEIVRQAADAMVKSGMKDAGYQYIVIDDCWHGERDSLGFIQADSQKFPSGIKALADYIHSLGLKFGIYSDAGWQTCGGRPGSRGHEYQDAMKYAEWGVDYLKYDWCNTEGLKAEGAYLTMRNALYTAGRPIVFSLCEWGNNQPWNWAKNVGHLWRTTGDISAIFDGFIDHGTWKSNGVMQILDMQDTLRKFAGPDHWNDPDMMEVGNGMTENEDRAHFTMWCMLAAPLIAGNDLSNMSETTKNILTNKEAISVDQDSLGIEGFKYAANDSLEIWLKPLENEEWAVTFLNRAKTKRSVEFSWNDKIINDDFSKRELNCKENNYSIYDIWEKAEIGTTQDDYIADLDFHSVKFIKLIPLKK